MPFLAFSTAPSGGLDETQYTKCRMGVCSCNRRHGFVTPKFAIAQQSQATAHPLSIATSGILLFNGTGTSGDVGALEYVIVNNLHLDYDTAATTDLNKMSQAQLAAYKLLIIPGGDSIQMGKYLSANTLASIKNAVRVNGLHYLGVCAGAFLASYGGPTYNDIDLLNGIWFNMYGETKEPAAELLTRPNGQSSGSACKLESLRRVHDIVGGRPRLFRDAD
jgi:hypothetical protein